MSDESGMYSITAEQWMQVLGALGYSTGAALRAADRQLANRFMRLANELGAASSDFVPYAVVPEGATPAGAEEPSSIDGAGARPGRRRLETGDV
jgi:hypothetical protein